MVATIKAAAAVLAAAASINAGAAQAAPAPEKNLYADVMHVAEIDREADTVTFETATGNRFVWEGVEDILTGEVYGLLMDGKGTADVRDDEVVAVKYSCYEIWDMVGKE